MMNPVYFDITLGVIFILNIMSFILFFRRALMLLKLGENGFSKLLAAEQFTLAGYWLWFIIRSIQVQSSLQLETDFNWPRLGAILTVALLGLILVIIQVVMVWKK